MRILYGVVGEGMGHATRSRLVIEHLARAHHEVLVVVSGAAHTLLKDVLAVFPNVRVEEIAGLRLAYAGNVVDKSKSFTGAIKRAPADLWRNIQVYRDIEDTTDAFAAQAVFSDFDSWSYFYGKNHFVPIVSIDNMQILHRARLDDAVTNNRCRAFRLARAAVKAKLPGAYHYLITSFFFPPLRKKRTTLVPPILRPEILAAKRDKADHILCYLRAVEPAQVVDLFAECPHEVRAYGSGKVDARIHNVQFCGFSEQGFVDDLRTARAVVAGGGFSLMSEAVHLGVPMLSVPIGEQFEQELNARYLEHLGYGRFVRMPTREGLAAFLDNLQSHEAALATYPRHDNTMTLACVDALVRRIERKAKGVDPLDTPNMGAYLG